MHTNGTRRAPLQVAFAKGEAQIRNRNRTHDATTHRDDFLAARDAPSARVDMGRDVRARFTTNLALVASLFVTTAIASGQEIGLDFRDAASDSRAQCANAIASNDPPCAHGTMPATASSNHPENCASCAVDGNGARGCPAGWTGTSCDVCQNRVVCEKRTIDGALRSASACTSKCWTPTEEELRPIGDVENVLEGKVFSCACGGDTQTDAYCKFQANTTITMRVVAAGTLANGKPKYEVKMREYGGMPRQDQAPDVPDKYKYAAPAVWDGNFTQCSLTTTSCPDPLPSTETCAVYDCQASIVSCPPSDVEPCPGRNPFGCGYIPKTSQKYWQHPCNPLVTPGTRGMKFWCGVNMTRPDGSNVCYWSQNGVIPTLALTCHTGSCVYEMVGSSDGACPVHFDPPQYWTGDTITRAAMFVIVLLLVTAAWAYIRVEADTRYFEDERGVNDDDDDDVVGGAVEAVRRFESTMQPKDGPSSVLTWMDINVEVKSSRTRILTSVSGIAGRVEDAHGGMCALMGPSGAGKTTLLDRLAGRLSPKVYDSSGDVFINGKLANVAELQSVSGYVTADDVLPGTATVYEHLLFHAKLRLPSQTRASTLQKRVRATMQILGIEKLADSFIGDQFQRGLSGGEKRRVSIATELLMSPGIMFLDEPTTGLDSTNAAKVVDILSGLGAMGTTVLLSIHQPRPDIFRLLDRVLVLSGDGNVVYSGPSALASAHFGSLSFVSLPAADLHIADYMLDVVLKSPRSDVREMVKAFAASEIAENAYLIADTLAAQYEDSDATPLIVPKYVSPYFKQVRLLWRRLALVTLRHPFLLGLHFVSTAAASFALGLIFWDSGRDTGGIQNRMGCLFFIILYLALMSLSSLPIWKEDQVLFRRERASGVYGTDAYFTAVVLFDVVILRVLPPLFFAGITYWMVGLHATLAHAGFCALILIMTNVSASVLCMCVGIASPSNASANVIGLLVLLTSILCGGFLLNKQDPHSGGSVAVTWIENLSFVNYAFEALMINEFLDAGTFYFTPKLIDSKTSGTDSGNPINVPVDGKQVLEFFSFGSTRDAMVYDITTLFSMMCFYLTVAYVLLKVSQRDAMY
jgi:ATP-binding cassette subfamily G (WHITE) protein 2